MPQTLRNKTQQYIKLQWWLFAMLLIFCAAFYLLVYYPAQRRANELAASVEKQRQELEIARQRTRDLPRIAAENEELALRLARSKRVPRHSEWADFVRDITRLSNQSSLRKFSYKYSMSKRIGDLSQLPIVLEFEGDAMDVQSFLRQVEDLPRLTRLRSVVLKAQEQKPGQVHAQVALNTYFSTEP